MYIDIETSGEKTFSAHVGLDMGQTHMGPWCQGASKMHNIYIHIYCIYV